MGDWRRCPKCRYIRHVNDDGGTRGDTCPRCGAVYEKAAWEVEKQRRRRSFRAHREIRTRACKKCGEPVSVLANDCPLCDARLATPMPILVATVLLGFSLMVGWAWLHRPASVESPYPGMSDTHFERCVELSINWLNAQSSEGNAARETISAQNDWHKTCSRKALGDIARHAGPDLPASPREWVNAING
ncbi:MAG: hypothetical protein ACU85V_08760 [Gammaproteobacteria bacterium]